MLQAQRYYRGFTLIELISVIAVIGILAAIVMPNLSGTREHARDSERVTEVAEIALAVELYYNQCRQYPPSPLALTADDGCPPGVTLGTFLSDIPTGPQGDAYTYETSATFDQFVIRAVLETNHKQLSNDLDGTILGVECNEATNQYYYCKGS